MSFKRPLSVAAATLVVAIGLSACGADQYSDGNKDPHRGWVKVSNYTWKKCDGTTMVYEIDRGGSTVPNSPECR